MIDRRSRVTVVGDRRRLDVAIPAVAPVGEYAPRLAELCGQERGGPLPRVWSLQAAGAAPLPLDASLADHGVTDGQVLYLSDLAGDPTAGPVVEDIDELVGAEAETQRGAAVPRSRIVIGLGLAWLVATAAAAVWRGNGNGQLAVAGGLITCALLLIATGWTLNQRRAAVPAALRLLVSLTAVPCMAVAGEWTARFAGGPAFGWPGAIAGANLAAVMAIAATPEAVIFAIEVQLAVAAALVPLLIALRATGVQTAAATVIAALSLIGLSKRIAAVITTWSQRTPPDAQSTAHAVTQLLIRARRLLTVVVVGPTVALAVALPVLAFSRQPFAMALAAVAGAALLIRAEQSGFTNELVLIGGAGLVGVFGVLGGLIWWLVPSGPLALILLAVCGLGLVAAGAIAALTGLHSEATETTEVKVGGVPMRPVRRRFVDVVGMLCMIASASLVLGVFGVFEQLTALGRGMFG
jgi:type VII secretion integral membrane protein EccD